MTPPLARMARNRGPSTATAPPGGGGGGGGGGHDGGGGGGDWPGGGGRPSAEDEDAPSEALRRRPERHRSDRKLERAVRNLEVRLSSKNRVKEADSIKVPAFPTPQQYRSWKNAIRNAITAASGRGEEAFLWAIKPEESRTTFEGLRDSSGSTASMLS